MSLPTKNDPKYQTLPYNAKLFTPFATKQEQEQFEKNIHHMQILQQGQSQSQHNATAQLQFQVQQYRRQQQQLQNNQQSNLANLANKDAIDLNEQIQSYNNKNNYRNINNRQSCSNLQHSNKKETDVNRSTSPTPPCLVITSTPQLTHKQDSNAQVPEGVTRPNKFLSNGAFTSSPSASSTSSFVSNCSASNNGCNSDQVRYHLVCTTFCNAYWMHIFNWFTGCNQNLQN